jgi:hypothetical protein
LILLELPVCGRLISISEYIEGAITMELPYDGDTDNPNQYCKHGTFIGSWWGPDYLCGWCEDGVSVADMKAALTEQRIHRQITHVKGMIRVYGVVLRSMAPLPYDPALATNITSVMIETPGLIKDYNELIAAGKEDELYA